LCSIQLFIIEQYNMFKVLIKVIFAH